MDALALAESLNRRGITITVEWPKLIVRPSSLLTDQDRQAIRQFKPELLRVLPSSQSQDEAYASLLKTLARIEDVTASASVADRYRVAEMLAEFGRTIELLFERRDFASLRHTLIGLERDVRDAVHGRNYHN